MWKWLWKLLSIVFSVFPTLNTCSLLMRMWSFLRFDCWERKKHIAESRTIITSHHHLSLTHSFLLVLCIFSFFLFIYSVTLSTCTTHKTTHVITETQIHSRAGLQIAKQVEYLYLTIEWEKKMSESTKKWHCLLLLASHMVPTNTHPVHENCRTQLLQVNRHKHTFAKLHGPKCIAFTTQWNLQAMYAKACIQCIRHIQEIPGSKSTFYSADL